MGEAIIKIENRGYIEYAEYGDYGVVPYPKYARKYSIAQARRIGDKLTKQGIKNTVIVSSERR